MIWWLCWAQQRLCEHGDEWISKKLPSSRQPWGDEWNMIKNPNTQICHKTEHLDTFFIKSVYSLKESAFAWAICGTTPKHKLWFWRKKSSSLKRLNVSCLFVKVIGLFAPSLLLDISVFRLFALPLLRIGFFAALCPLSIFFLSLLQFFLLQGTDWALAQKPEILVNTTGTATTSGPWAHVLTRKIIIKDQYCVKHPCLF